jgi:hypothetical protein
MEIKSSHPIVCQRAFFEWGNYSHKPEEIRLCKFPDCGEMGTSLLGKYLVKTLLKRLCPV